MKKQPFAKRLLFALNGIRTAWALERSFRTQAAAAVAMLAFLVWARPAAVWWATIVALIAAVLAAELFNTALETVVDHLHPETHPLIGRAKDCAAGAVLVLSVAALAVFAALLASMAP